MTSIGELARERIELNPEVPFPPFPVYLRVPSTWSQLDSNPQTWRRSADDLIDTTFRGSRLRGSERRGVFGLLEGLVADCQRAGAALSLITVGRREAGGAASFGLHLAFGDSGRPASLGRVHDILPRTGTATEIATGAGPAIMHRDRMTMVVPGTAEMVALTTIQVFVPIPGTTWTVVLSTASAYPELTEPLESMLRIAAESVTVEKDSFQKDIVETSLGETDLDGIDLDGIDLDGIDLQGIDPHGRSAGSRGGFATGDFGTMVMRRLDGGHRLSSDSV